MGGVQASIYFALTAQVAYTHESVLGYHDDASLDTMPFGEERKLMIGLNHSPWFG